MPNTTGGTRAPTIRRRILVLTFVASSVALLAASGAMLLHQGHAMREGLAEDIYALAGVVGEAAQAASHTGNLEDIRRALEVLSADGHIRVAGVYDQQGALLVSYAQRGSDQLVPSQAGIPGPHFEEHGLGVFRAVDRRPGAVGAVYLYTDLERIRPHLDAQLLLGVVSVTPAFLVAALVAWRAQRRISLPLRDLTQRVVSLRAEGLAGVAPTPIGHDEVEVLVQAFDDMQAALRQRDGELRRSEQYYRALIDRARDVTLLLAADLRVRYASPSVHAVLGRAPEDMAGCDLASILDEGTVEGVRGALEASRAGVGHSFSLELRALAADGEVRVLEGLGTNLLEEPAVRGIVMNLRDITERHRVAAELKRAKDAAEDATRAKTQFLANVSHEIRTPMNAVIGMSEVLAHTALSGEQRRCVEVIQSSGVGLLRLIDDLLDASRLEFGRLVLHEADLDLGGVVEGALDLLAGAAHAKGLDLAGHVDPRVPSPLRGDAARLRQVLMNLLGNAVDLTPQGYVELRVVLEGEEADAVRLRFTVADTGPGVSPALRATLFQPFVKGRDATGRKLGGTGIGLTICRSLVELMGGQIGVEDRPSGGACFWITLSMARAPGALAPREQADLHGARVLVVEAGQATARTLADTLSGLGAQVWSAAGGEDGRGILAEALRGGWRFDAALIDAEQVHADTGAWIEELRAHPALAGARLALLWPLGALASPERPAPPFEGLELLPKPLSAACLLAFLSGGPVAAPADATAGGPGGPRGPAGGGAGPPGPARILVAEDNPLNQEVLLLLLRQLGYVAESVANGAEAVDAVARADYDLVLMDCEMPVMDGFAATASIRRREAGGRRVPIVAVTAHALESERQRCLAVGMDDWLVKPLGAGPLRAVLERWLAGPTSAAEERLDPDVWAGLWRIEAGGQPGTVAHLVNLFLEDAAVRLTRMRAALASADGPALARQAHAFKGGCRQVGAVGLEMIAVRLEEAARSGEIAGLEGQIDELESALACLEPLLRSRATAPFRVDAAGRQGDGPVPSERRDSLRIESADAPTEDTKP